MERRYYRAVYPIKAFGEAQGNVPSVPDTPPEGVGPLPKPKRGIRRRGTRRTHSHNERFYSYIDQALAAAAG